MMIRQKTEAYLRAAEFGNLKAGREEPRNDILLQLLVVRRRWSSEPP